MSADNWMVCPKCRRDVAETRETRIDKTRKLYGKIPEAEYREKIVEAEKPVEFEETFREDYEQGMTDCGEYFVSYSGHCSKCGFRHSHEFKEQILK